MSLKRRSLSAKNLSVRKPSGTTKFKSHSKLVSKRKQMKRKTRIFANDQIENLFKPFNSNLIVTKFRHKNRFDFRINKDQPRAKILNSDKLEFSKEESIPFMICLRKELSNLLFQLMIALTASYGYFAFLNYFKLAFVCLILTIYLYHAHLTNQFKSKIFYCSQLIKERSELQMAFFNRMNASQLVKLDSNEQIDERAKWLNDLLYIFWPYINCLIQKEVDRQGFAKNGVNIGYGHVIYFENFTLGDRPPVISSIAVNKNGCRNDELVIDMKLLYSGNCLLSFSKQTLLFFRMNAGVKDIYFRCNARLFLRPLMNCSPYFGGYSFHLIDKPIVDYEGINFANLADNQLFKNYLVNQIAARIVIPNCIYFSMFDEEDVIRKIKQPIPVGLCFLQIIEAENLPNLDEKSFLSSGHLDAFCTMRIGGSRFDTPIVYRTLNPYWLTTHTAPIHDLFDIVRIDVQHRDTLKTEFIGSVEFSLKDVVNDIRFNGIDKWLPISRSSTGNIHFRITYFELICEFTKSDFINLSDKVHRSNVKFPLGIFLFYIYDLTLDNFIYKDKLIPLIQIRFNGVTYQTQPINRKKSALSFFVEECYQFATSNPAQDVIEFIVLDVSGFNLAKLVSVDMLSSKIIGNCAISLNTILNKTIFLKVQKEKETKSKVKDSLTKESLQEGGFIQKIELFTCQNEKRRRRSVGHLKVFVSLSICKLNHDVYENLQQNLHIKTNPDQLTSDTSFLKRIFTQQKNSIIMSPLKTLNSIKLPLFTESIHEVNVAVIDDVTVLPDDLDQDSCYVKLRFFWPERKSIFIEVLRIVNVPKNFLLKNFKYSVSISLGHSIETKKSKIRALDSIGSKLKLLDSKLKTFDSKQNTTDSKGKTNKSKQDSVRSLEYNYFIKRTSKLKYNFNLNSIIFNQRLAFDLNPQLHIEEHIMTIQLNAHSTKFCFDFQIANQIASTKYRLPSIIFRCEPIERWIRFER